jgi:hypothetical protein
VPCGPDSLKAIFEWPRLAVSRLLQHALGNVWRRNLHDGFQDGVLLTTDYSGFGGAELALYQVACETSVALGADAQVVYWSASDKTPTCRMLLLATQPPIQHVFGDIHKRDVKNGLKFFSGARPHCTPIA